MRMKKKVGLRRFSMYCPFFVCRGVATANLVALLKCFAVSWLTYSIAQGNLIMIMCVGVVV